MIKADGVNTTTAVRRRPTVVGICMCMRCEREETEDYKVGERGVRSKNNLV